MGMALGEDVIMVSLKNIDSAYSGISLIIWRDFVGINITNLIG